MFDLDPGEGVPWPQVQEAALLMRALLDELGLQLWLKTSGGKGLHVVVPLEAEARLGHGEGLLAGDRGSTWRARSRSASSPRAAPRNRVGKSSSTTCATAAAPTTAARSRHARGPAWASRCRWRGTSWTRSVGGPVEREDRGRISCGAQGSVGGVLAESAEPGEGGGLAGCRVGWAAAGIPPIRRRNGGVPRQPTLRGQHWCRREESNPRPSHYE